MRVSCSLLPWNLSQKHLQLVINKRKKKNYIKNKMGFFGALAGYATGKTTMIVLTVGLYAGAIGTTVAAPFNPALVPVASALWTAADASGAMLISPIDPVTAAVTATTTIISGPV